MPAKNNAEMANEILKLLKKEYPGAGCALVHGNPLELLISTILSAQCTDKRVNIVTKGLFKKYRKLDDYLKVSQKEFEKEIRSTGFYKNKAKNILGACKMIKEQFNCKVPDTMDALIQLPGVARKTANIVLSNAYGKLEGIAVDTHVRRLSGRLGLSKYDDPEKIEQDLMAIIPRAEWWNISNLLIWHGRQVCFARKPNCAGCVLNKICPSAFKCG